jgi:hypothetical protein
MKRGTLFVMVVVLLSSVASGRASAQGPFGRPGVAPFSQPTVSPYLNLLRGDTPAAINYYGLVRPEFAALQNFTNLQQEINLNRSLLSSTAGESFTGIPISGHPAYFLNTGGYFLTTTPRLTGARQPGTYPQMQQQLQIQSQQQQPTPR